MFGWEFPPHIAGGLGTACYGMTRGLARNDVDVTFVMPRASGDEDERFIRVVNASDVETVFGKVSSDCADIIDKMSFMFTVDGYEWEKLESDHPTRRITKIGKIYEISAVTFPAYDSTSIEARNADRLESVKRELESARAELRADIPLDSGNELELIKEKIKILGGL